MIAHEAPHLDLDDQRNWRTRSSVHVIMGGHHIQVDAAPELRLQCVWNGIPKVDTFILTHGHADHLLGMDDLRRYIDLRDGLALPVYSTMEGLNRVRTVFPYAIQERAIVRGYPAFQLREFSDVLETPGGTIRATLLPHGRIKVLGLFFEEKGTGKKLAYYTDCKEVTPEAEAWAKEADVVVLDALRPQPHPSHMSIAEATEAALRIGAPQTFFTHLTHFIDHATESAKLPPGIAYAHDGLRLTI
jgi:phosphoribosyl 1,2-cyclic phosphate phosphodiesterase